MSRIIRLTERDLTRLVKRVINEEQDSQNQQLQKFQKLQSNIASKMKSSGCFDASNYPNLYKASSGSFDIVVGLLAMAIASGMFAATFGFSTFASITLGSLGGYVGVKGLKKIYDANISKIRGELGKLSNCLF